MIATMKMEASLLLPTTGSLHFRYARLLPMLALLAGTLVEIQSSAASIGDPAPPLPIERWIKGTPTRVGPGANVFVVEFWATWCGPCKRSIPHLTAVQQKFAKQGLIILGVSDEKVEVVQPFVAGQGGNMEYRVAVDSSKRSMENWLTAFGENGIPHAFVVDTNGIVVWHGFPNEELDRNLEKILAGDWDLDRAKRKEAGDRLVTQYTALVTKSNAKEKAAPLGDKILAEFSQDWRIPYHLAKSILTDSEVRSRDVPLALRAATKAVEMTHRRNGYALAVQGRAQFANGQKEEGLDTLKQALTLINDSEDRAEIQELLTLLEKGAAAKPAKRR